MVDALVIGEQVFVWVFKIIGIDGVIVSNSSEALAAIHGAIAHSTEKIIFVQSKYFSILRKKIIELRSQYEDRLIIEIPLETDKRSSGMQVQRFIKQIIAL
ncbi:MAG: V-type ATP synthase subunit F [Candidatus Ranarchaeia archaeon]